MASMGVGAQRVAGDAVGSTLAFVFVCYAEPTTRREPMLLTSWSQVHHERRESRRPTAGTCREWRGERGAAASVTLAVERVGATGTLPDSRSTRSWIMSKLAPFVGSPATQPIPIIPPRRDGSGR